MSDIFEQIGMEGRVPWKTVQNYTILIPEIYKATSSAVYLAEVSETKQIIAMKVYKGKWIQDHDEILKNETDGMKVLSSIGLSPATIGVFLKTANNIYFPQELCNCGSIDNYINRGPLPTEVYGIS